MQILLMTQARMGSTRLPGKVLKKIGGHSLLEYHLQQLQTVKNKTHLKIATTLQNSEEPIVELCHSLGLEVFRGSEADVLSRFYEAAREVAPDIVVRVTSDCPLIDPEIIDQVISTYQNHFPNYDYVSNTLERTYPRGMDVEVMSFKALEQAHFSAKDSFDREHVTPYLYRHPEKFRILQVKATGNYSDLRLTVDTPEDFELIEKIISSLGREKIFSLKEILKCLEKNPDWLEINRHVEQKVK